MFIRVESQLRASHVLETNPGVWDLILILDSSQRPSAFAKTHSNRFITLHFDDIIAPRSGRRGISTADFTEALEFARSCEHLLVTCRAGQARSVALAFSLCHHLIGKDDALSLLRPGRHEPNTKVIEVAVEVLQDQSIEASFLEWKHLHRNERIGDNLEEIAAEIDALEKAGLSNRLVE